MSWFSQEKENKMEEVVYMYIGYIACGHLTWTSAGNLSQLGQQTSGKIHSNRLIPIPFLIHGDLFGKLLCFHVQVRLICVIMDWFRSRINPVLNFGRKKPRQNLPHGAHYLFMLMFYFSIAWIQELDDYLFPGPSWSDFLSSYAKIYCLCPSGEISYISVRWESTSFRISTRFIVRF